MRRSEALFAENPADKNVAVFHAGLLLHLEQFERARGVLSEALNHASEHPPLLVNLSIAQRACGLISESVETAEKAVALDPALVSAWNALLIALQESGRKSEAQARLKIALSHHPDAPSLQHHLVLLEREQGQCPDQRLATAVHSLISSARELVARGALGPAEKAYRQALRLDAGNAAASSGLGILLMRIGRLDEAIRQLSAAVALNSGDYAARHFLAVAKGSPPPVAAAHYVRELFDAYASDFDQHLSSQLSYQVPQELAKLLEHHAGKKFGQVLDLGCGTGLLGESLAAFCEAIDGVDLSAEMLLRARARGCYRELHVVDMGEFVKDTPACWDAVTAADVFIYYGDVSQLFKDVHRHLQPGGWLAFSVESTDAGTFWVDPASGRYQHSRAYLEQSLGDAGFKWPLLFDVTVRIEHGEPIPGWIVLAQSSS